jgi:hypothetical protein
VRSLLREVNGRHPEGPPKSERDLATGETVRSLPGRRQGRLRRQPATYKSTARCLSLPRRANGCDRATPLLYDRGRRDVSQPLTVGRRGSLWAGAALVACAVAAGGYVGSGHLQHQSSPRHRSGSKTDRTARSFEAVCHSYYLQYVKRPNEPSPPTSGWGAGVKWPYHDAMPGSAPPPLASESEYCRILRQFLPKHP